MLQETKELLKGFYGLDDETFKLSEEVMEDMVRFEIERNIKERLVYLTVKKIVINQLFSDKPSDLYSLVGDAEQEQPNGKTRHKVIKFNSDDKK